MIPQSNPRAGYLAHQSEIDAAIARVLDSGWYILGKEVESFEHEFAAWLGVNHAVGVANGTDAIELALKAAGVREGDQVATVSHTAVATVAAIRRCGAIPLFVDIEADYYCMESTSLAQVLEKEADVKAIVVVHLYGQMADMTAILELADRYDAIVIEDCAQAHGASLHGRKAGTWGDFGCFSFYPTKNLAALGDGGAVVTGDESMAERLMALRQYGWDDERISQMDGVNSRLDEVQAAVLRVKLQHLDAGNEKRRSIAAVYAGGLESLNAVVTPKVRVGCEHVYHQFVVRVENRTVLREALQQKDVLTAIHYPQAAHLHPAFASNLFKLLPLTKTESTISMILSLPMFPELSTDSANRVIDEIRAVIT